jgi:hypothetical protein
MFSAPALAASTSILLLAPSALAGGFALDLSRPARDTPAEVERQVADENDQPPLHAEPLRWRTLLGGGALFGGDHADVHAAAFVAFETPLAERLDLSLEFTGYFLDQTDAEDAFAGAFTPTFRYELARWDEGRWGAFVDFGIGVMQSTERVSPNGTHFNFTPRAGVGLSWEPGRSNCRFLAGARWQHFSNARIDGSERNESFDSLMLWLGVSIPF